MKFYLARRQHLLLLGTNIILCQGFSPNLNNVKVPVGSNVLPLRVTRSDYLVVDKKDEESIAISSKTEFLEKASRQHEKEIQHGFQVWGQASPDIMTENLPKCEKIMVPLSSIGPDGQSLYPENNYIYKTEEPLFTTQECQDLIEESRQLIARDLASTSSATNTDESNDGNDTKRRISHSELNEARVSTLEKGKVWLQNAMHTKLFPLISSCYGIPVSDLTCQDALCIGYLANAMPSTQPIHRDASLITCNIALTPLLDKEHGGGTYIEALKQTLTNEGGHVMTHLGGIMHAGVGHSSVGKNNDDSNSNSTERWILVVFCLAKNVPQLARYCHKMGMDELRDNDDLIMAKNYYQAGLSVSPNDALLNRSLGNFYLRLYQQKRRNDINDDNHNECSNLAKYYLRQSAKHYTYNVEALMTLGKLLLEERRPRAALRVFDIALDDVIQDSDLKQPNAWRSVRAMAWEARSLAARCAVMCASWEEHHYQNDFKSRSWSRQHLPRAISRAQTCLQASPQDENLHRLYSTAQYLLDQANHKG